MSLYEADFRFQDFHVKRPIAGGGVYGGRAGALGVSWLWDGFHTDFGARPDFLPLTTKDPIYEKAVPQVGMIDPATNQADPDGDYVCAYRPTPASKGSTVRFLTCGGGGWGDPLERDPERVKVDVRDEYITIEGAARDYGVVIAGDPIHDPEGLRVNTEATEALRAARRP
jgi:N-methylhydantoinase B